MFRLAHALGKTISELEQMPEPEFYEWVAFFGILKAENNG
jgi:hypothetical protein